MNLIFEKIEKAIYEAGEILLEAKLKQDEIFEKEGPANFVTAYDIKIQEYLISRLSQILPEATYYGEESTDDNIHGNINEGYVFFIDPIDGTTNFLFDYDHSCVSVGLSKDGKMIAGFIYDPYVNKMYKGFKNENDIDKAYLNNAQISVRNVGLSEGIAEFGCARYVDDRVDKMFDIIKQLFFKCLSIRNGGSAALAICRIACETNVTYFEMKLQPYDYAAASVILEAAGGKICQMDGSEITLDAPCSIVAGTVKAVDEMLKIVKA